MWLYEIGFSSLAATCVKKDVTKEGKFERDQIHEKSKERYLTTLKFPCYCIISTVNEPKFTVIYSKKENS